MVGKRVIDVWLEFVGVLTDVLSAHAVKVRAEARKLDLDNSSLAATDYKKCSGDVWPGYRSKDAWPGYYRS